MSDWKKVITDKFANDNEGAQKSISDIIQRKSKELFDKLKQADGSEIHPIASTEDPVEPVDVVTDEPVTPQE